MLIEHEWYQFKIYKEVDFPGEPSVIILIDPDGYKHLLKKDYYINYNFCVGDNINCRIDKINCSGKIFLEPEHPFYKEGHSYDFDFVAEEVLINSFNEKQQVIIVSDIYGNKLNIPAENALVFEGKVNCLVENIKKGKLFIMPTNSVKSIKGLKEGDWFEAQIERVITSSDNEDYYIVNDQNNNTFYLKKKYYENYNFSIGNIISCKVVKIRSPWDYIIEPKNPYYNDGNAYSFIILDKEPVLNYQQKQTYFFIFNDIFNIECKVEVNEEIYDTFNIGDSVLCLVDRVKKSKLMLKYIKQ